MLARGEGAGGARHAAALGAVDAAGRDIERAAKLDLDESDGAATAGHDVDLAAVR